MFDWDDTKRRANLAKHGVDFAEIEGFDWTTAKERPDDRRDYGEQRIEATGLIGDRVHVLVYVRRDGVIRVISLRRANGREVQRWLT